MLFAPEEESFKRPLVARKLEAPHENVQILSFREVNRT